VNNPKKKISLYDKDINNNLNKIIKNNDISENKNKTIIFESIKLDGQIPKSNLNPYKVTIG